VVQRVAGVNHVFILEQPSPGNRSLESTGLTEHLQTKQASYEATRANELCNDHSREQNKADEGRSEHHQSGHGQTPSPLNELRPK
jgi:hypothetical protein